MDLGLDYFRVLLALGFVSSRFCTPKSAWPVGVIGVSRQAFSGFYNRLWVTGYAISSCRSNLARGVIARHGAPLRSICLISTNASAATCCILLHAKAYVGNRIQMLNTTTYAPHGMRRGRAVSRVAGGAVLGKQFKN